MRKGLASLLKVDKPVIVNINTDCNAGLFGEGLRQSVVVSQGLRCGWDAQLGRSGASGEGQLPRNH